ncbi:uncharacterized protein LOC117597205 isoform X1 [Pangasianodon hypophthalmus]|uniref:uncharacterized protein LOC117597205 isoform X1 n=1 Tax=Pangasianodon hypophthalmus TaxID=310915 RepID=UPI002307572F|nr:uncharacterized protein LOC117597205 isoform X1 [Pangasianodon hypophthalmus]
MDIVTKQLYRNKYIQDINCKYVNLSLMSEPEAMLVRKNSLRGHEEETLRGTRLKREPSSSGFHMKSVGDLSAKLLAATSAPKPLQYSSPSHLHGPQVAPSPAIQTDLQAVHMGPPPAAHCCHLLVKRVYVSWYNGGSGLLYQCSHVALMADGYHKTLRMKPKVTETTYSIAPVLESYRLKSIRRDLILFVPPKQL